MQSLKGGNLYRVVYSVVSGMPQPIVEYARVRTQTVQRLYCRGRTGHCCIPISHVGKVWFEKRTDALLHEISKYPVHSADPLQQRLRRELMNSYSDYVKRERDRPQRSS
jgi:hypothetical protein